MGHIVWDFNGTLFDDLDAVVCATNDSILRYGLGPFTAEDFRSRYTRPIWVYYERLLGRPLAEGEWERLDEAFHSAYRRYLPTCALTAGARELIDAWSSAGHTQSLLSMWRHAELVPKVMELGVAGSFVRIDGVRAQGGGLKAEHLVRHLAELRVDPATVLVVGDSVDDAHAARAAGARAVLYSGGMHSRASLEEVGVPVVDSLADVAGYVGEGTSG
ncbi:HAD family hydrolase [Allonocardiopsis opalescens]|uniref:Phosphoglycolate phosphatase-like HAD superfamily hydrolase n=1 Tax=Allonocardiopsis opalescens TaxID=1144618 RepID=A0A2T0QC55_9ACTN|nr:HAD hydrolase-like protein [Allonocardiopsis opalescens]PRY01536.1 phosphoglycolate phosphatase-like HAD superfamily hydrolase [Allonocardiopsis opalescens]